MDRWSGIEHYLLTEVISAGFTQFTLTTGYTRLHSYAVTCQTHAQTGHLIISLKWTKERYKIEAKITKLQKATNSFAVLVL